MSNRSKQDSPPEGGINRRKFLKGMGTGLVGSATLSQGILPEDALGKTPKATASSQDIEMAVVRMKINGKTHTVEVEPRAMLLDVLREKLQLTGSKKVCNRGECGACTVILNGETVYACMMLAIDADGAKIETVEGLGTPEKMHPIQEKFIEHDAYQCGFCTPGFEMAMKDLLDKHPIADLKTIKKGLAGNTCRCGAYPHIFDVALELTGKKGGR